MSLVRALLWPAAIAADVFAGWILGAPDSTWRPDTTPAAQP